MKRLLGLAGALALLAWTGAGLLAWAAAARRVTVVFSDPGTERAPAPRESELAEELSLLRQDVRALAAALGENIGVLDQTLARREERGAAALERSIESLRGELERATRPLRSGDSPLEPAGRLSDGTAVSAEPAEASTRAGGSGAEAAAPDAGVRAQAGPSVPRRASFLAFELPSDDLRFDERRSWSLVPALSRVGFDAQTTLHDFSGVTSALEGELEVDLARPGEHPRLTVLVDAAALETGEPARDDALRVHVAAAEHPRIVFELAAFEPAAVEPAERRGAGRALGRMTIRGVARDVAMDLRYSLDDARRLCVDGEMALDLDDFGVPVPSKLGLITMESEIRVWISLRLRARPGSGNGA